MKFCISSALYTELFNYQREIGDIHGISQPALSQIVHKVIKKIAGLCPNYITFPTLEECDRIQRAFYEKRGMSGVIGAIDCTHVEIIRPSGDDSELYRNRKGYFSINVQLVCDDKLKIRNIVASCKGSTHDSRIFNESSLKDQRDTLPANYHLLGDRGCLRYLMTPLANPVSQAEKRYNFAQSSTRTVIERLNGVLKRRFPCLGSDSKLRFTPKKCGHVIVACAVLHNFHIETYDEVNNENPNDVIENDDEEIDGERNIQGNAKMRSIIANYFNRI